MGALPQCIPHPDCHTRLCATQHTTHLPPLPPSSPPPFQALQHHIREEEDEMLVEYSRHVDRNKLEELSKKFHKSKQSVPTRCGASL